MQAIVERRVVSRLLSVVALIALTAALAVTAQRAFADAEKAGQSAGAAKELFNGKDLAGWAGDEQIWSVEDGAIVGRSTAERPLKANTFLVWRGGMLKDFELRVRYLIESGNSGIQYRSADRGDHVVAGYQADIVSGTPDKYSGILYEEKGRGIIAQRGEKVVIDESGKKQVAGSVGKSEEIVKAIKPGEWNEYVITARGNHLVQQINGVTTVDVTDHETAKAAREGVLALQVHVGPPMTVRFKDIRLTELKPE